MIEPASPAPTRRPSATLEWAGVIAVAALLVAQFLLPRGTVRWLSTCGAAALLLSTAFIFPPFRTLARHGAVPPGRPYYDTTRTVDRGAFAIVRHPQYVGYMLLAVGFALRSQHPLALGLAAVALTCFAWYAAREERDCLRRFGEAYATYRRRVPRFNFVVGLVRFLAGWGGRVSPGAEAPAASGDEEAARRRGDRREPMTVEPGRMESDPRPIGEIDRQVLLRFARQTLEEYLSDGRRPAVPTGSGALLVHRAAFVTLRTRADAALRGCVGEIEARRPLVESVMNMAIAAATEDPRFPPVEPEEVPGLHIEISALTPMEPILPNEVQVGRHGLMIRWKGRSGLLLPQVPESQGWSRDEFLRGICRKAGLPDDAWAEPDAELLGFECEVWEEEHDAPSAHDSL